MGLSVVLDRITTALSFAAALAVASVALSMYRNQTPSTPQPNIPREPVSLTRASLQGSESAKVVLMEFSDFQCPFCRQFAQEVLPQVVSLYVAPGRLRFALMLLPLASIHPLATKAAKQALCAGRQGRFWEMHDQLFQGPELTDQMMAAFPAAIGVQRRAFDSCMIDPSTERVVQEDVDLARTLSVRGTPTLFAGLMNGPSTVRVVTRIVHTQSFDQVASQLDSVLKNAVRH